jgi:hypothetical protein
VFKLKVLHVSCAVFIIQTGSGGIERGGTRRKGKRFSKQIKWCDVKGYFPEKVYEQW